MLCGVALLYGIGFTMGLFIGLLAFQSSPDLQDSVKIGELARSLSSAVSGAPLLFLGGARRSDAASHVANKTSRRQTPQGGQHSSG